MLKRLQPLWTMDYSANILAEDIQQADLTPLMASVIGIGIQSVVPIEFLTEFVKEPVDFVSLIFVLSALHPGTFIQALKNINYKILKPGGTLLFRDYGIYDVAMLRFKPGHKLMENFYVRQDGTRAYYFSKEMVNLVFNESGFVVETNNYVHRRTVNLKESINVPRILSKRNFLKNDVQVLRLFSNPQTIFRFSDEVQILSLDSSSQAISKLSDYCIFMFSDNVQFLKIIF
ncbi:hypothetical protein CHUAL_011256 [Chamberlinius hualienensis]